MGHDTNGVFTLSDNDADKKRVMYNCVEMFILHREINIDSHFKLFCVNLSVSVLLFVPTSMLGSVNARGT